MENKNVLILGGIVIIICLIIGIGLGRAYYGIPDVTQRFESKGITVHYGKPNKMLYTHTLHIKLRDDFLFFAQKYNVTEVWIVRGLPPFYYFIKDGVRYYW